MENETMPGNVPLSEGLGVGAEARYLASDLRPAGLRFRLSGNGSHIADEDFIFDALLKINGDFGDGERKAYAQWIIDALNAADAKLPRKPRDA